MDASGRIDSEMKQAKKRINQLITKYKYNSDYYDAMGMIGESDAIAILEGATKVLRKALESIVKDYKIDKKQIGIISKHIDDIKTNLKKEITEVDILPEGCGVYRDRYGIDRERTYEDAFHEFEQKVSQTIETMDTQKLRLDNYRIRRGREARYNWLPIVISFASLMLSILSFIVQIIWSIK